MPTYTCWAQAGAISQTDRAAIARTLMEIHHEVAVAPRYLVQVVFADLSPSAIFVAGEPAPENHVWIRADIRAGRTVEQKRLLLERITTEVSVIIGTAPEDVWVYICEIPGSSMINPSASTSSSESSTVRAQPWPPPAVRLRPSRHTHHRSSLMNVST